MKVPFSVENAFIPMEAEDIPSLQDQRRKRNQYWTMLRRARLDFIQLIDQAGEYYPDEEGAFYYYLKQNYGLHVELIDGNIASDYVIVDEKKYLLFLLKFGS